MRPWEPVTDPRLTSALRVWRTERNRVTQSEVARALGVHRSTYNLIENGRQPLTFEQLGLLATFYRTDPDGLLAAGDPALASGDVPASFELEGEARAWLWRTLADLASQGFSDADLHEAREVLTAPVLVRMATGPGWTAKQTMAALQAVLDAVVIPALARRASGGE